MEYLTYWCQKYMKHLKHNKYVVLKDKDGDYSFLWYAKDTDSVAHQMEDGFSPTVYPPPKYEVVDVLDRNDIKLYTTYRL